MGQGYSLTTLSAGSAGIDVPELSDLAYEKSLGDARFMKAIRARHRDGLVVAKVVMKPYASMKLTKYIKEIIRERNALTNVANALGYHRAFETSSNGYLVRQYVYNSLYDRMSTRPFLEDIEKRWLAFQLLTAIRDCHSQNVYHGDIKTENILVTSWNWLYLSDFSSSFKPTFLPEDNPAEFSFYFDIAGRRTCYIAPERFLFPGEKPDGRGNITWAMDVFSAGCAIAELFLETPIFNLSQLFDYRKGNYDPEKAQLSRIEDQDIRELVSHMIQLEPESRYSADEYLNFWRRKAFPEYFYSFLHGYMHLITDPGSGRPSSAQTEANTGLSDDRIDRVYSDFDKISYFLGYDDEQGPTESISSKSPFSLFPLHLDIPNKREIARRRKTPVVDDGTLLFLNVVTSALRSTARATARIRACDLLLAFAERLTDEAKLDRVLPFVMTLVTDRSELVKVAALRTLTQLLSLVSNASPVNAYLFPEYIHPRLESFATLSGTKHIPLVRITYASCIATLAETASRFLDVVQALKAEGSLPSADPEAENGVYIHAYQNLYDVAHGDLVRFFESQTKALLTDSNPDVRRAFLGSVSSLCVFFGSSKANDVILSHLNTYLNDRDWKLKCAFFETIVGVATYVGSASLEEFILPLMIQALSDPEEFVLEKVLRSFASMAELGLFSRSRTWELVNLVSRFTMHPNIWVREAAAHFLSSATSYVSVADCECVIKPLLNPYFRTPPSSFSELDLLDALKKPLSRIIFDMAITWADKADSSTFWKGAQQRSASNMLQDRIHVKPTKDHGSSPLSKQPKNNEDQQWLTRLRNAGMRPDDEFKLIALRDHIWRLARRKSNNEIDPKIQRLNRIVPLKDLNIAPETVFFDHSQQYFSEPIANPDVNDEADKKPQTIADALLDASTTIGEVRSRRSSSSSQDQATKKIDISARRQSTAHKDSSPKVSSPLSASPLHANIQGPSKLSAESKASSQPGSSPQDNDQSDGKPTSLVSPHDQALSKDQTIIHKPSAISLMQKQPSATKSTATTKSAAATSTSSANAYGKVERTHSADGSGQTIPLAQAKEQNRMHPSDIKYQAAHSYDGHDPSVLKLLDTLYLENYPVDAVEFGPTVTPVERRQWEKKQSTSHWRPNGTLIALFGEHTGSVNRVIVAPDHTFFITGSDDGTVKIWDTARLERNLAHRSRQTYKHAAPAKITALTFVEDTHTFISADSLGGVHVVKVDCQPTPQGAMKYNKLKTLRQYTLPYAPNSHAVWIEHFKGEPHSTLLVATNTSKIVALDLKTMSILYTLQNPLEYGTPSSFCIDPKRHWLLLGTSHGLLSMWDLRFRLRLRTWGFPAGCPIHRVCVHPIHGTKRRQVCVAGGTSSAEVTVWDLDKLVCKEVYRVPSPSDIPAPSTLSNGTDKQQSLRITATSIKPYTPWFPESSSPDTFLSRFASAPSSSTDTSQPPTTDNDKAKPATTQPPPQSEPSSLDAPTGHSTPTIQALTVGARAVAETSDMPRYGFFVAAGADRKVRFWDMDRVEASCVVSGREFNESDVVYIAGQIGGECVVCEERVRGGGIGTTGATGGSGGSAGKANVSAKRTAGGSSGATPALEQNEEAGGLAGAVAAGAGTGGAEGKAQRKREPKTSVVNMQQQVLMKTHLDVVTDVAVLEFPFPMVVSVDRAGGVYVFS